VTSLRNRLLVGLVGAVVVVGTLGAWLSYRIARAEADAFFDAQLRDTALLLRDEVQVFPGGARVPRAVPEYDFIVQVWSRDGVQVYLSRPHEVVPGLTGPGLSTTRTSAASWRVFGVETGGGVIQVAQPMDVRERRAARLALRSLAPFAVLVPTLSILIAWIVSRTVRPVGAFADALRRRRPDDVEPVAVAGLPDEVRPVAEALNELLARLRAALERERAFLADAAHELRTPLTALDLQAQAVVESDAADREAALRDLRTGVARVARLVEQLLAIAREQHGTSGPPAPLDLDELVRRSVADFVPLAEAAGIDLGIESAEPVRVAGDADALRRLLGNLLDNAVRYTPAGGRVDVTVGREPGTPSQAAVAVIDTGPGIPREERERVFDRFHRVPGTAVTGSGLGLALARSIAARHDGELVLEDGPGGRGLRAVLRMPAYAGS
jgi:two-component system, OmpR family, sensor kinase